MDPGADAAAGSLKGRSQLAYHKGIGHKIQCEHQDPAENNLYTVKVYKAVEYISEAPDRGKGHERQSVPGDFL